MVDAARGVFCGFEALLRHSRQRREQRHRRVAAERGHGRPHRLLAGVGRRLPAAAKRAAEPLSVAALRQLLALADETPQPSDIAALRVQDLCPNPAARRTQVLVDHARHGAGLREAAAEGDQLHLVLLRRGEEGLGRRHVEPPVVRGRVRHHRNRAAFRRCCVADEDHTTCLGAEEVRLYRKNPLPLAMLIAGR